MTSNHVLRAAALHTQIDYSRQMVFVAFDPDAFRAFEHLTHNTVSTALCPQPGIRRRGHRDEAFGGRSATSSRSDHFCIVLTDRVR